PRPARRLRGDDPLGADPAAPRVDRGRRHLSRRAALPRERGDPAVARHGADLATPPRGAVARTDAAARPGRVAGGPVRGLSRPPRGGAGEGRPAPGAPAVREPRRRGP